VVDAGSDVTTRCQLRPVSTTSWQHPVLCQTLQRGLGANMNLSYAFVFDRSSADSSAVCDQLGLESAVSHVHSFVVDDTPGCSSVDPTIFAAYQLCQLIGRISTRCLLVCACDCLLCTCGYMWGVSRTCAGRSCYVSACLHTTLVDCGESLRDLCISAFVRCRQHT
jgi:hypothetical protein